MSRDKRYQRLFNSKRWKETKFIVKARAKGLCEDCRERGLLEPGIDCHHVIPVESAANEAEMERLCFDVNNIRLLCVPCHIRVHQAARSHTKQAHQQRQDERLERWKQRMSRRPEGTHPSEHET